MEGMYFTNTMKIVQSQSMWIFRISRLELDCATFFGFLDWIILYTVYLFLRIFFGLDVIKFDMFFGLLYEKCIKMLINCG